MNEMTTVLGHRAPDSFRNAVMQAIREIAEMLKPPHGASTVVRARHTALVALADFTSYLKVDDLRLVTLYACHAAVGGGRLEYKIGGERARLLASLGSVGRPIPQPGPLLDELCSVAVNDTLRELQSKTSAAVEELAQVLAREAKATRVREDTSDAWARFKQARSENEQLQRELAAERQENAALRALTDVSTEPADPPVAKRRERVPDHPGIYQRTSKDGETVYEITWTDDGRQRWRTIGPSLEEAVTAREGQVTPEAVAS